MSAQSPLLAPKMAADYDILFNAFLTLAPNYSNAVKESIGWAKKTLKKQNRVVWFLRWVRLEAVRAAIHDSHLSAAKKDTPEAEKAANEDRLTQLSAMNQKLTAEGQSGAGHTPGLGRFMEKGSPEREWLEHIFSLQVPAIQGYDPEYKNFPTVKRDLTAIENEYKEQAKGTLTPQAEDSIFLDCGGGWAWWLLPRASCDSEAKAMGHCGNSPDSERTDMSILSLRQKKQVGGKEAWEPHLTFILHRLGEGTDSGTLGEMKGKGNDKPVPKYFPYIVRLLCDERIKGIDGGGYLPEHNFSPKDLSKEQRAEVEEANPTGLLTMKQYYRDYGFDDVMQARVAHKLNIENNYDGEGYVIRSWPSHKAFMDDCADLEAQQLADYLADGSLAFFVLNGLEEIEDDSPAWRGIAGQLALEFEIEVDTKAENYVGAVRRALKGVKAGEDSTLRQVLEESFEEARTADMSESQRKWRQDDGLRGLLDQAENNSTEDTYSTLEWSGRGPLQTIPEDYAIECALQDRELGHVDKPSVSVDLDIDADTFQAYLEKELDPEAARQRLLEQRGQERLFKRPESDEEAQRDGIKISYLLLPKTSAQDYEGMFAQLLTLDPKLKSTVEGEIEWGKRILKKSNRITWWLRWVRIALATSALVGAGDAKAQLETYQKKLMTEVSKGGIVGKLTWPLLRNTKQSLEHFYSLAVPAIQNAEPGFKEPTDLLAEFEKAEETYIEQAQGTLQPMAEDKIYIDCGGGWAWWFLPRASCDREAKAMGHCGNAPGGSRKDRAIISLRQTKKVGKEERWEPHLTFILHTDPVGSDQGELGEMKGKGNAKPVERYHPYIIKILEDNRIKGIVGGGYKPENNFQWGDLTTEQQAEIRKANPGAFFTFDEYLEKKGLDLSDIADKLNITQQLVYPEGEDAEPGLVIRSWYDIGEFAHDCGDDEARETERCIQGDLSPFVGSMLKYFKGMEVFRGLAKLINREFDTEPLSLDSPKLKQEVCDTIDNLDDSGESELRKILEAAFLAGNEYTNIDTPFTEIQRSDAEWAAEHSDENVGKIYVDKKDRVYQYLPAREAIQIAMDEEQVESIAENGFHTPHMGGLRWDEKMEDPGAAEAVIEERLPGDRPSARQLEDKGQTRLFNRPGTDEEAARDGIKISYLLQPKQALTVSDKGNAYMALSGDKIVDEATIGDYEAFVLKSGVVPGLHLLGMQRIGNDAFDLGQQAETLPNSRGTGSLAELKSMIEGWLQKYGQLVIGSHNPEKTQQWIRLTKRLGFKVEQKSIAGMPMPVIKKAGEVKAAHEWTPQEVATLNQKLRDEHELNTRLDDHLEVKNCAGCGEDFYANRNDGDYCCYEHSDGHWHGDPAKAGVERTVDKLAAGPHSLPTFEEYAAQHGGVEALTKEYTGKRPFFARVVGQTDEELLRRYYVSVVAKLEPLHSRYKFIAYRAISLPRGLRSLDRAKVGIYWTPDERKAQAYWGDEQDGPGMSDATYVLQAELHSEDVDWVKTLDLHMEPGQHGDWSEEEIRLKDGVSIYVEAYRRTDETNWRPLRNNRMVASQKTAYVSNGGELTVAIDNGQRPKVTISLDLGIPNFTRFAITVPVEMLETSEIDQYARQAFEALLQDVSAFLVVMKFPEDVIADALSNAEIAFLGLDARHSTDARMPDFDHNIRMYECGFKLPEEFIQQTRDKVVTASIDQQPVYKTLKPSQKITTSKGMSIRVTVEPHPEFEDSFWVAAHADTDEPIGTVSFLKNLYPEDWGKLKGQYTWSASSVWVREDFRRKGIASAMYKVFESSKRPVVPSGRGHGGKLSPDGAAFWDSRTRKKPKLIRAADDEFDPNSITASVVKRIPEVRQLNLTPLEAMTPPGTPDRSIQFFIEQSTMNTPRAFNVQVVERPAPSKAREWGERRVIEQAA